MSKFDPNGWYAISETRVDKTNKDLKNSLQLTADGMRVFAIADDLNWQLHPVDDKKPGRYVLRSFKAGVEKQLAACRVPAEKDSSRTRACLEPAASDESQQWDISDWGDGTYKIQSVANGTKYWLDVHPGADVHLSSIEETSDNKREAQHWVLSSRFPVNDDRYSTLYSQQQSTIAPASTTTTGTFTRTTPTPSATATDGTAAGSTDGGSVSNSQAEQSSSGGLSTAAAAGVGVGVTLAVLAAVITLLIFWWKRRQAAAGGPAGPGEKEALNYSGSPQPPSSGIAPGTGGVGSHGYYSGKNVNSETVGGWPQQQQQQSAVASPESGGYYYQDQAKSPQSHVNTPATYTSNLHEAPVATTVVHEAPGPNMPAEMDGTGRQNVGYRP
ncbi:hypothetical protein MCOR25_008215 [Pyricularia grisea]|uniref:Ricin B lectin domain-containing protein n=1 Tax=Pyricularia grisea TaxID=148305 RepID=A0A6P8BE81_PYRGI|nr:uncharacterized protein PgNI_04135 [Pyricularia grisea]KAI6355374.1 hypothetical protein MCOR25_008215 [Pyricularia grisea]TLD14059.1 hypothetical protein PgNI_04135 [Pyricularia grisea]